MRKTTKLFLGGLMLCSLLVLSTNKSHAWKLFGKENTNEQALVGGWVCWTETVYFFGIVVSSGPKCDTIEHLNQPE